MNPVDTQRRASVLIVDDYPDCAESLALLLRMEGFDVCFHEVRDSIHERDERDAQRDASPMWPAPDAVHIVTDELAVEEVVQRILDLCAERERAG